MSKQLRSIGNCLFRLIAVCRSEEYRFHSAAVKSANPYLRAMLREFSRQRRDQASELRLHWERLRRNESEMAETIATSDEKPMATPPPLEESAIADTPQPLEVPTVEAYERVLNAPLPEETQQLVKRQFGAVRATYDRIQDMERAIAGG